MHLHFSQVGRGRLAFVNVGQEQEARTQFFLLIEALHVFVLVVKVEEILEENHVVDWNVTQDFVNRFGEIEVKTLEISNCSKTHTFCGWSYACRLSSITSRKNGMVVVYS